MSIRGTWTGVMQLFGDGISTGYIYELNEMTWLTPPGLGNTTFNGVYAQVPDEATINSPAGCTVTLDNTGTIFLTFDTAPAVGPFSVSVNFFWEPFTS